MWTHGTCWLAVTVLFLCYRSRSRWRSWTIYCIWMIRINDQPCPSRRKPHPTSTWVTWPVAVTVAWHHKNRRVQNVSCPGQGALHGTAMDTVRLPLNTNGKFFCGIMVGSVQVNLRCLCTCIESLRVYGRAYLHTMELLRSLIRAQILVCKISPHRNRNRAVFFLFFIGVRIPIHTVGARLHLHQVSCVFQRWSRL